MSRRVTEYQIKAILRAATGEMTVVEIATLMGLERHTVARVIRDHRAKTVTISGEDGGNA